MRSHPSSDNIHQTVWMAPPAFDDGKCFRELFEKPDAWNETRSEIDVLMYADHWLHKQFTDNELRAWFSQMQQWRCKFALEVGAIKPWGLTGGKTFEVQRSMWDRWGRNCRGARGALGRRL